MSPELLQAEPTDPRGAGRSRPRARRKYSRKAMCFARDLFARATTLDPGCARAWSGIADCCAFLYMNAGRHAEDLEQADAASRRALELAAPRRADLRGPRANGLVVLGETARGLEWADRALALDPDDAMLLYNLACIKAMAGAGGEALDCLERAVRAGMRNLGWLEHASNLDSIRSHPRFAELMLSLAEA